MKLHVLLLAVLTCGAAGAASQPPAPTPAPAGLGTSAAVDPDGRLWIAYIEASGANANVLVRRYEEGSWQAPVRVTGRPEPVSAEGENRPKLAFGPRGEIYVTWTSPTSANYTGDIHFARSIDGAKTWSAPIVVHQDRQLITHRFDSLLVDGEGRVWVAWVDKRDLQAAAATRPGYAGAAIYYAWSDDRGASWHGDFKLADHSCECCRIALARDAQGRAAAMWRHVFPPNERDHAFARLDPQREPPSITRVTFDRWRIDACPHHGPSLAFTPEGARHAVWFDQVRSEGRVFYGRLGEAGPEGVQALPPGANHADIASMGSTVAVAWKRFDGSATQVESWISRDGGRHFLAGPTLQSAGNSDQPRLVGTPQNILLVWRRDDGVAVKRLLDAPQANPSAALRPFGRSTLGDIERSHAGEPFWLVLWDLECTYCMKSLTHLAQAQRTNPDLNVVTITTDPISAASAIEARLAQLGVKSEAYAFSGASQEALRYAIDPTWLGEKPRAYRYEADGKRTALTGVIAVERFR